MGSFYFCDMYRVSGTMLALWPWDNYLWIGDLVHRITEKCAFWMTMLDQISIFHRNLKSAMTGVNQGTFYKPGLTHYNDVIMGDMASQIIIFTIVYSTVYSDADQRKHQNSASLAFVREIQRRPVNSPHKWPVTRKIFPFDNVIMLNFSMDE